MLTLRNIRVWDTGEIIDMVIPSADARNQPEDGGVIEGDFDATGLTVAPGFADPHVHFRDPGQTYKESMVSGCRAAASGGYTNVLIMPNTVPAMDGRAVKAGASGAAEVLDAGRSDVIDYLQHYERVHDVSLPVRYDLCVCASKDRAGVEASDPADWLRHLDGHDMDGKDAWQLAHPVTAISDDGAAVTPGLLDQVLANVKESGLYLIEHCEHHDTGAVNDGPVSRKLGVPGIPEDTELKIVSRDIEKARETGVHIHFQHVSTAISFDGPPIGAYGLCMGWEPRVFLGTLGVFFVIRGSLTVILQATAGFYTPEVLGYALYGAPGVILGTLLAFPVAKRIPQETFRKVLLVIIGVAGAVCLVRAFL